MGISLPWPFNNSNARSRTRQAEEHVEEVVEEIPDAYDLYMRWFMENALPIAAAVITADISAALGKGAITVRGLDSVIQLADTLDRETEELRERLGIEADRVRGVLDSAALAGAVNAARVAHRTGLAFVPAYRRQVEEFYNSTARLSQQVFGEAETLNSALTLMQMLTYDVSSLEGEPVDLAETRYFGEALRLTERVEKRSRHYARRPGAFWSEFTEFFLLPLQRQRSQEEAAQRTRLNEVSGVADRAATAADGVSERLLAYQGVLRPIASERAVEQLDDIRKRFKADVEEPLEEVSAFLVETWPPVEEELEQIDADLSALESRQEATEAIVESPGDLDEEGRQEQRERFTEIDDSTYDNPDEPPTGDMADVRSRVEGILEIIRRR